MDPWSHYPYYKNIYIYVVSHNAMHDRSDGLRDGVDGMVYVTMIGAVFVILISSFVDKILYARFS